MEGRNNNTDTPVTSSTLFNSYKLRTRSTGPSDVEGISVANPGPTGGSDGSGSDGSGSDGSGGSAGLAEVSWAGLSWVLERKWRPLVPECLGGFGGLGPKVAHDGFLCRVLSRVEAFWGGLYKGSLKAP